MQEALTNIARHAGVAEAKVGVWCEQGRLCLVVEDRGRGFDLRADPGAGTLGGLSGMRERAALMGGQLEVESAVGVGTRVTAELPVQESEERRRQSFTSAP